MKYFLIWTIVFVAIYLLYFFFVILRKKKLAKFKDNTYVKYLVRRYKLDPKKLDTKKLAHLISFANAFIIATVFMIVISIDNYIIMLLVALVTLIPLLLIVYHIIGKILQKGE